MFRASLFIESSLGISAGPKNKELNEKPPRDPDSAFRLDILPQAKFRDRLSHSRGRNL